MKLRAYEHLLAINAGFAQVRRALSALGRHEGFQRSELQRFREKSEEARAATMSYITEAIATAETHEAGRRYGKRVARERQEQ